VWEETEMRDKGNMAAIDELGNKNLKIVLCNVPGREDQKREIYGQVPNLAINSLYKHMKLNGYDAVYYDIDMLLPSEDEIRCFFKEQKPDVVGISVVVSPSYRKAKHIAQIIRESHPDSFIVLGGNMAVCANLCLRKVGVDVCAIGEGEKTWVSLLDYVKQNNGKKNIDALKNIKGIAFLNEEDEMELTGTGEPIPGSEYPQPDYDFLSFGNPKFLEYLFMPKNRFPMFSHDKRVIGKSHKVAILIISKGCVARCSFCQRFCKGYKTMDLKNIEENIRMLKEKYGIQLIYIFDECFGADKKHTYKVLEFFKKYDVLWSCSIRVTSVTKEDLLHYKDSGCSNLKFGIESGSQKMLTILDKGSTIEQNMDTLKNCYDVGILSPPSMLIGMPGETDDTIKESGIFLGKFAKYVGVSPLDIGCAFYFATPYPGTPLYEYGMLNGCFGGTIDEEERFLNYLSDKNLSKFNYINLTGESNKKTFFWDYLLMLEALRTYYTDFIKKDTNKFQWAAGVEQEDIFKKIFRKLPDWFNGFIFTKIPRSIIYTIFREFIYLINMKKIKTFELRNKPDVLTSVQPLRKINIELRKNINPEPLREENQLILYSS
jgi:radical SAM superfamily enzyme YgiQ (UPF0313 family)